MTQSTATDTRGIAKEKQDSSQTGAYSNYEGEQKSQRQLEETFDRILRSDHPFSLLLGYVEAGVTGNVCLHLSNGEPVDFDTTKLSSTQQRRFAEYCRTTSEQLGTRAITALFAVLDERAQEQRSLARRGEQ